MDLEAIVGDYLRDQPAVSALAGDRIGGKKPTDLSDPFVRITQFGDQQLPSSRALYAFTTFLQIDCYGSEDRATDHEEARALADAVRSALHEMAPGVHGDAQVSSVRFTTLLRLPDTTIEPARERFQLDVSVHAHPAL